MALYERIRRVSEGSTLSMEKVARTALKFGIEEARNRALAYYQAIKTAGEAFDADPDAQAARGGGQPPV